MLLLTHPILHAVYSKSTKHVQFLICEG